MRSAATLRRSLLEPLPWRHSPPGPMPGWRTAPRAFLESASRPGAGGRLWAPAQPLPDHPTSPPPWGPHPPGRPVCRTALAALWSLRQGQREGPLNGGTWPTPPAPQRGLGCRPPPPSGTVRLTSSVALAAGWPLAGGVAWLPRLAGRRKCPGECALPAASPLTAPPSPLTGASPPRHPRLAPRAPPSPAPHHPNVAQQPQAGSGP